jgi:methionyl-tRNA formyltransferase
MPASKKTASKQVTDSKKPAKEKAPARRKKAIGKIVFFGTPDFAVPTLDALAEAGRTPALIVSQPSRPAGRGQEEQAPPVVEWAAEHGVELMQPESVRDEGFLAQIGKLKPDVAVVVAFGQIFPPELLALPRHGCVNLHASLLPKYRGASPIQSTLIAGEKKTGVTAMRMEEELDTGPILHQEETKIRSWESAGELTERLSKLGAEVIVETLGMLETGKYKERKQREESASYAGRIDKEDGRVNWALESDEIYNRLRAYTPWPGMTTRFHGRPVKIVWGVPMTWENAPIGVTGTYLGLRQGRISVLCGNNTIFGIEELQRPGKKKVRASDFVNGERLRVGDSFA